MTLRLASRIATITLAGSLAVGGTALAAGGDGSGPAGDRTAKICANLDTVEDLMTRHLAEVQHRIAYFTEVRGLADGAGMTNLVARIDRALGRLDDRLVRLQTRLDGLDEWAAEHCTTPPTTEPPSTEPPATDPPATEPPTTDAPEATG